MNFCRYLRSFLSSTNVAESNTVGVVHSSHPNAIENNSNESCSLISVQNKKKTKSFFEKAHIKIKWSLRFLRNTISDSNLYQVWYLFGCLISLIVVFFALIIYSPLTVAISIAVITILTIIKEKSFFIQSLNEFNDWINFNRVFRMILAILIIVFGEYILLKYYPIPLWINILIKYLSSNWFNIISFVVIVSFSIGFVIEIYFVWKNDSKLLNIILKILGAISSFISLYFARWIIIDVTGVEPFTFSKALVIFTVLIGIVFWLGISILTCSLIYFLTALWQMLIIISRLTIFSNFEIRNNPWYRFWFRKPIEPYIKHKARKFWIKLLFFLSRGLGAGLLAATIVLGFQYLISVPIMNFDSLINFTENIIVISDYRPENKITECTNLEQGEWGLLVGYTKVSVAQSQILGGYVFTTKSCFFDDDK